LRKTSAEFLLPKAMQLPTACSISSRRPGSGDVIEVALGIGFVHVDGGGHDTIAHGQQHGRHAGSAACALRMANEVLQRRAGA